MIEYKKNIISLNFKSELVKSYYFENVEISYTKGFKIEKSRGCSFKFKNCVFKYPFTGTSFFEEMLLSSVDCVWSEND